MTDPYTPPPQNPTSPYGQQVPYGYVQQPGQPYSAARPTNTLAIVAFVLAFFVSVAGVICGHIALSQIKRTGEGGHGLALAAVIIGYVAIALSVIFVVIYVVFLVAFVGLAAHSTSFSSFG